MWTRRGLKWAETASEISTCHPPISTSALGWSWTMCCLIHSCWRVPWRKWLRRSLFWTSSASTVPHCCEAWHLGASWCPNARVALSTTAFATDYECCTHLYTFKYTFIIIYTFAIICNHLHSTLIDVSLAFWGILWISILGLWHESLWVDHTCVPCTKPRLSPCLPSNALLCLMIQICNHSISKVYHSKSWCIIVYHSIL